MSDANKLICPKCEQSENLIKEHIGDNAWCRCGWVGLQGDCATQPTPEAPPSPPQAPQAKRVRTSDATNDIENAFRYWRAATGMAGDFPAFDEAVEARNRVLTWLTQVSADQRQLHAALLACQAMAAVTDYSDFDKVHAARKLALDAMAEG